MKESNEILHHYASDMLAVEKHFLDVLNWQMEDSRIKKYREAYAFIRRLREVLLTHSDALEVYLSNLKIESSESALKKITTKVTGMTTGLYNLMRREDSVMRNLRDNYTALSMAAISYTMLHSTALTHHDDTLADLSLNHLKEITPLVVELSALIPAVVIEELTAEDKALDTTMIDKARENTQSAWNRDVLRHAAQQG